MNAAINKIYSRRLYNLKIMAKALQLAPFIRCIILNGSMAEGKIKKSSDIDLLIIAKRGRIFTCRAAVLFWAHISGLKRSTDNTRSHVGRFCFNYFLTDNFLMIPHNREEKMNKYCAENYSKSRLIWGDNNIFSNYMNINAKWMKKHLPSLHHPALDAGSTNRLRSISRFPIKSGMTAFAVFFEKILSGRFGNWVERVLKNIQVKKINRDPRTKKYPELIVTNNKELRFHPPKN